MCSYSSSCCSPFHLAAPDCLSLYFFLHFLSDGPINVESILLYSARLPLPLPSPSTATQTRSVVPISCLCAYTITTTTSVSPIFYLLPPVLLLCSTTISITQLSTTAHSSIADRAIELICSAISCSRLQQLSARKCLH